MTQTTNYLREAADDDAETVRNFADEILDVLLDKGEASDDLLNDYPNGDSWHHECHVDKAYGLTDAATLLDQLMDFEGIRHRPMGRAGAPAGNRGPGRLHLRQRRVFRVARTIEKINSEATAIIDDLRPADRPVGGCRRPRQR